VHSEPSVATSKENVLAEREFAALRAGWKAAYIKRMLSQRPKQGYASRLFPLRFIDVNRGARVSIEICVLRGGESNRISSANIFADENSTSIAFRSNKAIENVPVRGRRDFSH
jgi:hypothetical protein